MRFRKRPVEVEAVRWDGDNLDAIADFVGSAPGVTRVGRDIRIRTLEGLMTAGPGDWLIRGVAGELYPCKPDIFAATYEPVEP